jgi:hypothetical protein
MVLRRRTVRLASGVEEPTGMHRSRKKGRHINVKRPRRDHLRDRLGLISSVYFTANPAKVFPELGTLHSDRAGSFKDLR